MFAPSKHKRVIAGFAAAALAGAAAHARAPTTTPPMGSTQAKKPEPVAVIEALQGETTAVKLDQGFTDALASLKLTPGVAAPPSSPTDRWSSRSPVATSRCSSPGSVPNYVVGQIQHEGSGFTLTAGDTEVTIGNLNVDPGVSVVYGDVLVNGEPAASSVPIFDLNGSTLNPLETKGNTAILQGTQVKISETCRRPAQLTPSRPTR